MRLHTIAALAACGIAVSPGVALGEEFALKSNESVSLFGVYWVANCKSILKAFGGIDVLEGPPGVTLRLEPGMVRAYRQRCPQPVRGATVVATTKAVAAKATAKLVFRVRYSTADGPKQTTHTVTLDLYP